LHPRKIVLRPPRSSQEWDRLHAIRRVEIFDRYHPRGTRWWVPYDPDHPDDRKPGNWPLVQLLGDEVVGTCRVDALPDRRAALRLVAVAAPCRGYGLGAALVRGAEEFAAAAGAEIACLNAQPAVTDFYARLGWEEGAWSGSSSCTRSRPMRKLLRQRVAA
jgi:GNAT superfamily N-acetyltransferase